jgi:DNA-binding transcriptional LysR family regulator
VTLQQLRQFVTLAETLNFHRAAERLHIAQPPLSVSIRKLEEELGAALFIREPRGVRLTAAGLAALDDARQALAHAEQVQRSAQETMTGNRGTLRLGFVVSAVYRLLPALLPAFRARYPQIEISLVESRSADLLDAVEAGTIDAAIVRTPVMHETRDAILPLEKDSLCLAVAHDSRFAGLSQINLREARDELFVIYARETVPSMHAITMQACQDAGFVPRIAERATQSQTIICLDESGFGVALVPGIIRHHSHAVSFVALKGKAARMPLGLGLAIARSQPSSTAIRFRDFAAALQQGQ